MRKDSVDNCKENLFSYPTIKHLWLHNTLKYGLIQSELGKKHHPKNITVGVLDSILRRALKEYEDILNSTSVKP